jgi:lipopolysaccharide export system permease protein
MRILDRYIGATVTSAIFMMLGALVAVFSFFTFLDQLDDVGRGAFSLAAAMQFVVLSVPRLTYEMFPVAALIGSLAGLGSLVSTSEMAVIRAAGVSRNRIVWAVMKSGAVIMILSLLIGEFIAPYSEQWARSSRSIALADQIALKTRNGFWARDGNSYINIRRILPAGRVEDIYIYEFDEANRLRLATRAKSAQYAGGQWVLSDITQTVIDEDGTSRRDIPKASWESMLRPDLINMVVIDPDSLSMWDLYKYVRYLEANAQSSQRYRQALWSKLTYPLATGVMVFLAIPLVLGTRRDTNVGSRIVVGSLIGLAFHITNEAAGHLGVVFDLDPALSVAFPTLATLLIALILMRRVA